MRTEYWREIFARYDVQLRKTNTVVIHPVYRTKYNLTPFNFAVYESLLKAAHINRLQFDRDPSGFYIPCYIAPDNYNELAGNSGFTPLPADYETIDYDLAHRDYCRCHKWLSSHGLYELID